MFVPGKQFHPNIIFAGMAGAYKSKAPFRSYTPG